VTAPRESAAVEARDRLGIKPDPYVEVDRRHAVASRDAAPSHPSRRASIAKIPWLFAMFAFLPRPPGSRAREHRARDRATKSAI
jgi:hypothetical protein